MPDRVESAELELESLPLFDGLSPEQLEQVRAISHLQQVAEGETLLSEGEAANHVRIVLSGKFALCVRPPGQADICLSTLARGEMVGWSALTDGQRWLASAQAQRDSTVVVIDAGALRDLCERDPAIGYRVMRNAFLTVAGRLHDTRLQMLDMYGHG